MPNKKFSNLDTVAFKDTLLIVALDPALPVDQQNVTVLASNLPTGGTGGGASSIADLTDAADLVGTAYSFVGFDASAQPAAILSSVANTFVGFNASGVPVAMSRSTLLTLLGLSKSTLTINLQTVANGTLAMSQRLPAGFSIASLDRSVAAGSFTLDIRINTTVVTGLSALAVSGATNVNTVATGANVAAEGDTITAVITGATGAAGAVISLNLVRT